VSPGKADPPTPRARCVSRLARRAAHSAAHRGEAFAEGLERQREAVGKMKRDRTTLQVCLDCDPELRAWCEQEAEREGRSVSEFVRRLLVLERDLRRNNRRGAGGDG